MGVRTGVAWGAAASFLASGATRRALGARTGVAWVAAAAYLASAAACCALAARSSAHFVDIQVYRMGGAAVLHGEDLYRLRLGTLPFTYPPFAAVVLTALATIPFAAAVVLMTGASVAALPVTLYLALRL